MHRRQRLAASLLLVSVMLAACGSRLSEEDRRLAIEGLSGAGGVAAPAPGEQATGATTGSTTTGTTTGTGTTGTASGTTPSSSGAGTTGSAAGATSTLPGRSAPGGGTPADPGDPAEPADPGQPAAPGQPAPAEGTTAPADPGQPAPEQPAGDQPQDTRAAPAGGNGGETDIGVTADRIVLGNVSDVTGPVPGIFEPSQLAVKAYLAYFAATEGTIYGRQLQYLPRDGKLDTGANRAESITVCEQAFMSVGSMSANDQGAAPVIDECEIPDLRTAQTTDQMGAVDNAWATSVSSPGKEGLSSYQWIAEAFPDAVKAASFVFICGEVTEQNTSALIKAQEENLGYEYVYTQCIEIQETNYAPFVANMKDRGVEYVAFQGAYQQAARLAETMRQQDYFPTVYALQSNIYNENFIELGGANVEGSMVITASVPKEEVADYPELQLYSQWLNQVAPGELPDGLGMYSWSAAKLAVQLLKDIGPNVTREAMREAITKVDGWEGGGLHGPASVGPRARPLDCFNVLQVQDGRFVRIAPQNAPFRCGDLIANV